MGVSEEEARKAAQKLCDAMSGDLKKACEDELKNGGIMPQVRNMKRIYSRYSIKRKKLEIVFIDLLLYLISRQTSLRCFVSC